MTAGRPRAFTDPDTLRDKLNNYFEDRDSQWSAWVEIKEGQREFRPTMAGICVYLNISKETWSQYGQGSYDTKNEKYSDLVKAARMRIEGVVEGRALYENAGAGPIFWLKNHAGYEDKTKQEHTGKDGEAITVVKREIVARTKHSNR